MFGIKPSIGKIKEEYKEKIEEIRLRTGMPQCIFTGTNYFLTPDGRLSKNKEEGYWLNQNIFIKLSN